MTTYQVAVRVTEHVLGNIEVEAESVQEAKDLAIQRYWDEGDDAMRQTEIDYVEAEVADFDGNEVWEES